MLVCLTHDVDRIRKTYQYLQDLRKFQVKKLKPLFNESDPYWCFDKIMRIEDNYNVRSTFFFLQETLPFNLFSIDNWRKSLGKYDFNEKKVRAIIKKLDRNGWEIALHGSYNSYKNLELLKTEKRALEDVLGKKVKGIRQHFLNLKIPDTWNLQKKAGFEYDASFGFKNKIGFYQRRYSPFVHKNTGLKIIPLAIMDGYLFEGSKDINTLWINCLKVIDQAERHNGLLTILWHQRVFYEPDFPHYVYIYKKLIEECKKRGAEFLLLRDLCNFYKKYRIKYFVLDKGSKMEINNISQNESLIIGKNKVEKTSSELLNWKNKEKLILFKNRIENKVKENIFIGYNPYDLLASPFFNNNNSDIVMYLTQIYRILPFNIRKLLNIKKLISPLSDGILLSSFSINKINLCRILINKLEKNKSKHFDTYTAGLSFPIKLSWHYFQRNYPSLVISLFIMYGFINYYSFSGDYKIKNKIENFINLIDEKLSQKNNDTELWYSYTFNEVNEVYNATALVGKLYTKLFKVFPKKEYKYKINKILNYLINNQRIDGSWSYDRIRNYSDGFHTAFILEAIYEMQKIIDDKYIKEKFKLGLDNYCNKLIKNSKQPIHHHPDYKPGDLRRFINQTDIRDCAMAIILLNKTGKTQIANNVLNWTLENMYDEKDKYFYHYKEYLWTNKIEFIRPQAWMYKAIVDFFSKI